MELFRGYVYAPQTEMRLKIFLKNEFGNKNPVFLCLGTDRIVGDCLAPLTAEYLRKKEIPYYIYGGLNSPITAKNCEFACDFIRTMHPTSILVLIDSMATRSQANLGDIVITNEYYGAINLLNITPDLCVYGVTSLLKGSMLNCARLRNVEYIAQILSQSIEGALAEKEKKYVFAIN